MKAKTLRIFAVAWIAALLGSGPTHTEVVEEVVAWVNGDVIAKSELEQEEQMLLAEIYRRFTGAELDAQVKKARTGLLDRMIDQKILLQRAERLFDVSKMGGSLIDEFKQQNKFKNDDELQRALDQEGITVDDLKRRLIEMYAPQEMIRVEVVGRLSISDREIAAYYDAHPELFDVPAKATIREIVLLADEANREARRAEAEKIRERAAAPGADFAALAGEVSDAGTKSTGGLLAAVGKGDLAPALEQSAFEDPVGQVSAVIEMPHGFHILKVDERSDARRRTLEESKEDLRSRIQDEKYAAELAKYLKKARAESEIVVKEKYKSRLQPRP